MLRMVRAGGLGLIVALANVGHGSAQGFEGGDDRRCQEYGTRPGTGAYFECRADLARQRSDRSPAPYASQSAPSERDVNVSDGIAMSECEARARKVAPHPIKRKASSMVFPGRVKRVSISYAIDKPGSSLAFWNVECKFADGRMTDFQDH